MTVPRIHLEEVVPSGSSFILFVLKITTDWQSRGVRQDDCGSAEAVHGDVRWIISLDVSSSRRVKVVSISGGSYVSRS